MAHEGLLRGQACCGANTSGDDRVGDGEVREGNGPIVDNLVGVVDLVQEGCDFAVVNFTVQNPACF